MDAALPKIRIAHLPTPVEPLPRLGAELGGLRLFIKRDDQTGLAFGGNKTRKLEYLLAEAQANGARTMITTGAVQSNHCRQTAAAAARMGLGCILVLAGENTSPAAGNLLLDHLLGAELVFTAREARDQTLRQVFESAWTEGRRPYLVPYGGSSPTGAAAYAFAFGELLDQGLTPDWIVFASSSGGTQAGLVTGARLHNFQGHVLGISVDEPAEVLRAVVADLAEHIGDRLGSKLKFSSSDIEVNADYLGAGYGEMGSAEREAIQTFARLEGILLDPVYTGRAAAGLIDLARRGQFQPGETVLFWHTGGTPALFAGKYQSLGEN
ncbi:MAG: D-cysteine desulfhydrase family protein [Anaerolineales bacterium]|jgi:D-cysteine desulfhydrase family pyridoxal phosphate-dependent enzyme